jgi:hypothetical protein
MGMEGAPLGKKTTRELLGKILRQRIMVGMDMIDTNNTYVYH